MARQRVGYEFQYHQRIRLQPQATQSHYYFQGGGSAWCFT